MRRKRLAAAARQEPMTMTVHSKLRTLRIALALLLPGAYALSGCSREQVHQDVQAAKQTADRVADKAETSLNNARRETEQIKDHLPSGEQVRRDFHNMGEDVKRTAEHAANEIQGKADEAKKDIDEHTPSK
jgi:hypothetical protein